jgi:hypothetical protein
MRTITGAETSGAEHLNVRQFAPKVTGILAVFRAFG